MGLYRYEAVDKTGKVLHGAMNASDEQSVNSRLTAMGYSVRTILPPAGAHRAANAAAPSVAPRSASPRLAGMARVTIASGLPVSIKSLVPPDRLAMFFRQLVTLVRSGVPLYQSFADLANATRDRRLRAAIPEMQQNLQSGQLSGAMAMFPDLFPAHTVACIWSGELSGRLDVVLEEVATDMEREASDTRIGRIGWGITKIGLIGLIVTWPMFDMGTIVGPSVGLAPENVNPDKYLGYFTRTWAHEMLTKTIPISLALMVLWVVWGYIKRVPRVRRSLDGALLSMPVWGKLHRYRSLSRFLSLMDHLYSAGIGPGTAWDAASISPRNSAIAERLRFVGKESPSAGIADLAAMTNVLEPEDLGLIAAGEKTGQVPATLSKLATMYTSRADAQKTLGRMYSVSFATAAQLAIGGAAMIMMAKSYMGIVLKVMTGF